MRRGTGVSGIVIAWFALAAPAVTGAAGAGEPWGEQRGGVAIWLPRTGGPVYGAGIRHWAPVGPPRGFLEHRRTRSRYGPQQESYLVLKGGGLRVGEDPATDGVFFGLEVGGALERVFEVGFSIDYYYRSTEDALVLDESSFTHLPLQLVAFDRTAAHLVPLGVTLRLRLPLGGVVSPFISSTLAYEMLFLENVGAGGTGNPWLDALAEDETFTGFGGQAAAGLGLRLSPTVEILGEAGYHWGAPSQGYLVNGVPVDLTVKMDGPFLRAGLRFGL